MEGHFSQPSNFVTEIELGQKQPSLHTIFKLAIAFDVSPQYFVEMVQNELSGTK